MCSLSHRETADLVQGFILQTKPLTHKTGHSLLKKWAAAWFWHSAMYLLQWIYSLSALQQHWKPWLMTKHSLHQEKSWLPKVFNPYRHNKGDKNAVLAFPRWRPDADLKHQTRTRNKLMHPFLSSPHPPKSFFVFQKCSRYKREKLKTIANIQFPFICYIICWTPLQ